MNRERGFALPMAIFLLVILSTLAALLMRLTASTLAADAMEMEGERAYQAAQSGLEAGIYAASNGSCVAQEVSFSGALTRFKATVSCASYTPVPDEGGQPVTLVTVTSTACNQQNVSGDACPNASPTLLEYSERSVTATVAR